MKGVVSMSKPNKNIHNNYSIYDNMNTEMLEEILKSDYQMSDNENSDIDTILYIMEVIAKREKENPAGKFTEVHTAWESFTENYLPYIGDNKSLYDDETFRERTKQVSSIDSSLSRKKPRLPRIIYKTAIITILLFFTGTLTAKAFGFDLWHAVAKWTEDVFSFSSKISNRQESNGLKEILDKYDINAKVVPTWFPNEYLFENVDIIETPLRTTIQSIYSHENDEISITIISMVDHSSSVYEKDSNDIIIYSSNKIEHYIMKNLDRTKIIWMVGNYECSITGNFAIKEAEKMIDSIYRR